MPSASDVVVIVTAGSMVILNGCVAEFVEASVTCTVKFGFAEAVGVPEITPVVALSESPAGRLPAIIDHE